MSKVTFALATLFISGCSGPLSTIDPAGPAAAAVSTLWWAMLAGSVLLTCLVMAMLVLAFRSRWHAVTCPPSLWTGWLGIAMPGTILLVLLGYALSLGERTMARPSSQVVVVEATGHQWYWHFRQPGIGGLIETRDILHIPAGQPVDVRIASADVIHSFWVPRLGGKMDAIPGQMNVLRLEADRAGVFEALCAEFCGLGHTGHRFRVVAHDPAGWEAFQRGEVP